MLMLMLSLMVLQKVTSAILFQLIAYSCGVYCWHFREIVIISKLRSARVSNIFTRLCKGIYYTITFIRVFIGLKATNGDTLNAW